MLNGGGKCKMTQSHTPLCLSVLYLILRCVLIPFHSWFHVTVLQILLQMGLLQMHRTRFGHHHDSPDTKSRQGLIPALRIAPPAFASSRVGCRGMPRVQAGWGGCEMPKIVGLVEFSRRFPKIGIPPNHPF